MRTNKRRVPSNRQVLYSILAVVLYMILIVAYGDDLSHPLSELEPLPDEGGAVVAPRPGASAGAGLFNNLSLLRLRI